jgi:hypothetical protein
LNLLPRLAECFLDGRNQALIDHSVLEMLSQRVYGLALGYDDVNEYKRITFWKEAMDELPVKAFIESHENNPVEIILVVDTTDLPLHGKQQGRFFHGYYDNYCYLPLYIFCGEHVLCTRLREANHDAAVGSLQEIQRIVAQIRAAWPATKIILRGDSGFCRNQLMNWCENNRVDFVFGLARNQRLRKVIGPRCMQRPSNGIKPANRHECSFPSMCSALATTRRARSQPPARR